MKVVVVSDIHANPAALEAVVQEGFDRLICLGDLVGYGPSPNEVIEFVRQHALVAVRGNHDDAIVRDLDCHCSPANKALAEATLAHHRLTLTDEHLNWLRGLPTWAEFRLDEYRFAVFHAKPHDHLYGYEITPHIPDEELREEVDGVRADFVLLGHTHLPMVRGIGSRVVVDPGSVGRPEDGNPEASYAIIEDGIVELKRCAYDLHRTVTAIRNLPLRQEIIDALVAMLARGGSEESRDQGF